MTIKEIMQNVNNHANLRFEDYKISFFILKPNAAKHYRSIIAEIEDSQFIILSQFAIFDYETVNMALHIDQPKAMQYIIPITQFYKDFYSNFGILLIVAKRNITYNNFCFQILSMKHNLRKKFELPYISYAFDTTKLGQKNEHQRLLIIAQDGSEVDKDTFNSNGTFMIFSMNEIHSPDEIVSKTIDEIQLIYSMGIIDEKTTLPKNIISLIKQYQTFEFLKDMI